MFKRHFWTLTMMVYICLFVCPELIILTHAHVCLMKTWINNIHIEGWSWAFHDWWALVNWLFDLKVRIGQGPITLSRHDMDPETIPHVFFHEINEITWLNIRNRCRWYIREGAGQVGSPSGIKPGMEKPSSFEITSRWWWNDRKPYTMFWKWHIWKCIPIKIESVSKMLMIQQPHGFL